MIFGVGDKAGAEGLEVLKAELPRDGQHLGFILLHFVNPDLVNLVGGEAGGGGAAEQKLVVLCPVRQGGDAGLLAAGGDVADLKEAGEAHIGWEHFFGDGVKHFGLDTDLLFGLDAGGKLFEGQREGRVLWFLAG